MRSEFVATYLRRTLGAEVVELRNGPPRLDPEDAERRGRPERRPG